MINVFTINNKLYFNFEFDEDFEELLKKAKSYRCFTFEKGKGWTGDDLDIIDFIDENENYGINYKDDTDNIINNILEEDSKPIDIETEDVKLSRKSLVYPPIKGKPPYENFQINTIKECLKRKRYALFLDMGLGKSFVITTSLNQLYDNKKIDKIVIVAPSEGIYNWRRELLKFANFLSYENILISTANKNRNPFNMDLSNIKVIILTYRHFLTLTSDWYKIKYNRKLPGKMQSRMFPVIPFEEFGNNRCIILDESHSIRNPQNKQSKVILFHKDFFEYRYILTGTPTPNRFTEIYSQMKFLYDNSIRRSYYSWLREIANTGNRFSEYAVNYIYKEKQEKYENKFASLVSRYKSIDVLDLPEQYIKKIYTEMSDLQEEIYKKITVYAIQKVKEKEGYIEPKKIQEKFPFISLAYENAELLKDSIDTPDNELQKLLDKFDFQKHHGKLEILDSLLDRYIKEEKQKVVVFDFHPNTIENIAKRYDKYKPITIHGNTEKTNEERDDKIELFKNSKDRNLLVGSFRVLSTSRNLVECNRVIYFSRDFSYLFWSQSIKRFHRIGQDKPVIVNPIIFENSLDVLVDKSLEHKKDLNDYFMINKSLSKGQWKNVFKGEI